MLTQFDKFKHGNFFFAKSKAAAAIFLPHTLYIFWIFSHRHQAQTLYHNQGSTSTNFFGGKFKKTKEDLPKAWHCKIFVLPSATMEPEADGWVIKRGACSSLPETVPMTEKKKKERLWLDVIQIALRHGFGQMMTTGFFFRYENEEHHPP